MTGGLGFFAFDRCLLRREVGGSGVAVGQQGVGPSLLLEEKVDSGVSRKPEDG